MARRTPSWVLGGLFGGLAAAVAVAQAAPDISVTSGEIRVQQGGAIAFTAGLRVAGGSTGAVTLASGGTLRPAVAAYVQIGDGASSSRFTAYGSPPPRVATASPGAEFFSFVVKSGAVFEVTALEVKSVVAAGLTLEAGAAVNNGTPGEVSGITFDWAQPAAGATYLRFQHTAGTFTVKNCVFQNTASTAVYNISTPAGASAATLQVNATQGNSGVQSGPYLENDHGVGHDSSGAGSTIQWAVSGQVPMNAGWNLIALVTPPASAPFYPSGLAAQIDAQVGAGAVVAIKETEGSQWDVWEPAMPDLFPVELGKAYFVKLAVPGLWSPRGVPLSVTTQTWTFGNGLYGVGVPFGTYGAESLAQALNAELGAAGTVTHVRRWDGSQWVTHPTGTPFANFAIQPGRGYVLKLSIPSPPAGVTLP